MKLPKDIDGYWVDMAHVFLNSIEKYYRIFSILTYMNLRQLWKRSAIMFRQMDINRSPDDRFATSWSMHRGCHFYLWERTYPGAYLEGQKHNDVGPHGDYLSDYPGSSGISCFSGIFRCCSGESARVQNTPDYNEDKF